MLIFCIEKDLSDQREELRTVTITKNNIIEENVTKIKTLQDQLLESSNINEQQNVNLTEKLADLNSTIEQCREQKLNDDMTVAQINDTVKILKTQLSERDSEIVQLGIGKFYNYSKNLCRSNKLFRFWELTMAQNWKLKCSSYFSIEELNDIFFCVLI